MSSKAWKDKFISSGLPLEFEVGKILKSKKFFFNYDYSYSRDKPTLTNDSGKKADIYTDSSVDLNAWSFTPFDDEDADQTAWLQLLIECKYAHPKKKWLFLPDIYTNKFSHYRHGSSIRYIDRFSKKFLKYNATESFDKQNHICYKETEIDIETGDCEERPVRKGISQLQYALPRLIYDYILECGDDDDFALPLFFCPILVTTAELRVLKPKVTIEEVNNSTNLDDIAITVPYLVLISDCGPDFQKHCAKQCDGLQNNKWRNLTKYRRDHGESDFLLPETECRMLSEGWGLSFFSPFVVCSLNKFPILLQRIKKVTSHAANEMTDNKKDAMS